MNKNTVKELKRKFRAFKYTHASKRTKERRSAELCMKLSKCFNVEPYICYKDQPH